MKAVLRAAVSTSGRPLKAIAAEMGVKYAYLADATNEAEPQRFPADLLVPFMRVTKSLAPLRWLARELDCAVVQLPTVTVGAEDLRDRFLKAVEEVGKDSAVMQRVLADGEITASEGRELAAEVLNTIDVLREVIALVEAKVQRPVPARMTLPAPAAIERRA